MRQGSQAGLWSSPFLLASSAPRVPSLGTGALAVSSFTKRMGSWTLGPRTVSKTDGQKPLQPRGRRSGGLAGAGVWPSELGWSKLAAGPRLSGKGVWRRL